MRIRGGYLPKIAGKPSDKLEDVRIPEKLLINLQRRGLTYTPVVKDSQSIKFGEVLAEAEIEGGKIALPSPVSGKVSIIEEEKSPAIITIEVDESNSAPERVYNTSQLKHVDQKEIRATLARAGIWPFFWSSKTEGIPSLSESKPRAIIVNFFNAEPFRARGDIILKNKWQAIMEGIKFMNKLLVDYGTIEIMLPKVHKPLIKELYDELAGYAWVKFHSVPFIYPNDNVRLLVRMIKKLPPFTRDDDIWVMDIQGVEALGACFTEGIPVHQKIIAIGGPGTNNPRHLSVRIGTPLNEFLDEDLKDKGSLVLRGGIFLGETVNPEKETVNFDDDSFFILPEFSKREFLSFLRPGFNRTSYLPAFATVITRGEDTQITNSLRGEIRPCISCGLCENICPVGLMPQVLHRYLYAGDLDGAEKLGLNICIDCNLCTFICPSKIELQKQFAAAREELRLEHEEANKILANKKSQE